MLAISASRPRRMPWFTTRRRSSVERSAANTSAIASQLRAAKHAPKRSSAWLAAFSSRGFGGLNFLEPPSATSKSSSSKISNRLIWSPSTVRTLISRHSALTPSGEISG